MRASPGVKNKTIERDGVRMSSVFRIAVLSGMALLWVIVAVLQYKWATQLSAATEVRIGSNLQSLMTRSEEHTSELQSRRDLVCRLLLEKKKKKNRSNGKVRRKTPLAVQRVYTHRRS